MSSYLKTLRTKFGDIVCDAIHENWGNDEIMNHGDGGKFKFYDGDGKYLDYWEAETICSSAADDGRTPKEWWDRHLKQIEDSETFEELTEYIGDYFGWVFGKDEEAKAALIDMLTGSDAYGNEDIEALSEKSFDEITEYFDYSLNRIGDYTIVNFEDVTSYFAPASSERKPVAEPEM